MRTGISCLTQIPRTFPTPTMDSVVEKFKGISMKKNECL